MKKAGLKRMVLHIDMDAFFAAVEERDKPRLKGLPVAVGSDPKNGKGRGVVSTANYAAREYGIRSGLAISRAWELSQRAKRAGKPEVVFMEPNIKAYAKESNEIFSYIAKQGDGFEKTSIDEGYLAIFGNKDLLKTALEIGERIKKYVREKHGLSCSIGIAPNKLVAKIAAGRKKPDGLTLVKEEDVQKFLDPLSVREISGIGPKTEQVLGQMGIKTIKELRQRSKAELVEKFGKHGEGMYYHSRGIDESEVSPRERVKSIGEQITFEKDTLDANLIIPVFRSMAKSVHESLKKQKLKFRTVSIVVRFSDFQTQTRSRTLKRATDSAEILANEALNLFMPFLDSRENPKRKKIRLIGVRAEKLE